MTTFITNTSKLKKLLFFYWLIVPALFGLYLFLTSTTQRISVEGLLTNIPGLALTSIVSLISIFQAFGLYYIGNTSDCRQSLFGYYLLFSLIQQLFTLNVIGVGLTLLLYRSLLSAKETKKLSAQVKLSMYGLMVFIGFITFLVVIVRFSI
ncbi:hypothetical protein ACYSNW_03580 [Enterococcus sp. LJL99]